QTAKPRQKAELQTAKPRLKAELQTAKPRLKGGTTNGKTLSRRISSMTALRYILLALAAAAAIGTQPARAQNPAGPLSPPSRESPLRPKLGCSDLRSLTGYEFTVESAILIPASGDQPEYCRVRGQILPEIRFEVDLPATWNRRFYMTGNG